MEKGKRKSEWLALVLPHIGICSHNRNMFSYLSMRSALPEFGSSGKLPSSHPNDADREINQGYQANPK